MILTALILGAALIGIAAAFWKDLVNFLQKAIHKVQQIVAGIVYGCRVLVKKIREGVKEISRHYSKVENHWEETTITKIVPESEVPTEILERARAYEEVDITEELEMQLEG